MTLERTHAPADEFKTLCGRPVWDEPFAGHVKHITCPECRRLHPDEDPCESHEVLGRPCDFCLARAQGDHPHG